MLKIKWVPVTGTQEKKPATLDTTSSPNTVYLRRNVRRELIQQGTTEPYYAWTYEEAALTLEEYAEYEDMVAQVETPAIQTLREQNIVLAQALADIYETLSQVMEAQNNTSNAIMAGLVEIYEAQTQEGGA